MTAMISRSKKVYVEVNTNMPRCLGGFDEGIHVSQVTGIIEGDNPAMGQIPAGGPATDIDKTVAKMIVERIPDGACLQQEL